MNALVLGAKNAPLILQERPDLQPGEGEAIVQVYAAALNHRDVWIQKGQYAGLKYPLIPGSDGAGVVVSASPDGASWVGKEVIINPAFNWGNSPSHQHPKDFRILGLPDDGTFAEYVKVPVHNLAEKPVHLSFEEAAALPLAVCSVITQTLPDPGDSRHGSPVRRRRGTPVRSTSRTRSGPSTRRA